ncbi:MAG: biotin--[acetyl-CoA-carboxylase] ligase [Candidatus Thorarchaeota archaeon]
MVDPLLIASHLDTKRINPEIIVLEKTYSTNAVAQEQLLSCTNEVTVVIAKMQEHGKGRHDRTWHSPQGGLFMSIAISEELVRGNHPLMGILAGCATASAIHDLFSLSVRLKWPNDLLVNELKIGGILSELVTQGDEIIGVVIGIGVNQNIAINDLPTELRGISTSIQNELGHTTSVEQLVAMIINSIDSRFGTFHVESSFNSIISEWKQLGATIGKRVRVYPTPKSDDSFIGTAIGIDDNGALLILKEDGAQITLTAGEVFHLRNEAE